MTTPNSELARNEAEQLAKEIERAVVSDEAPSITILPLLTAALERARLSAALARTERLIETLQSNKLDDALYADSWTEYIDLMCEKMRIAPFPADLTDALELVKRERDREWQMALGYHTSNSVKLVEDVNEAVRHSPFINDVRMALKDSHEAAVARIRREARAEVADVLRNRITNMMVMAQREIENPRTPQGETTPYQGKVQAYDYVLTCLAELSADSLGTPEVKA